MKRIVIITALAVTLIFSAYPRLTGAGTRPATERRDAAGCRGFSVDIDNAKAQSVDAIVHADLSNANGPGAEVAVLQDGRISFLKGYGFSDLQNHVAITEKTVFNLASVSKQFTAIAIMKLVEQGKLSLQDKLTSLLPEFSQSQGARLPGADQIKVKHLLTHTSGLPDYIDDFGESGEKLPLGRDPTNSDVIRLLSQKTALQFNAGSDFKYSNSGYVVLAQIVEKKSGIRFANFMKNTFFDRLGMSSTFVKDERPQSMPNHANAYDRTGTRFRDVTHTRLDSIYGDGNAHSTVCDLAIWFQALLSIFLNDRQPPGGTLISQDSLKQMFRQATLDSGRRRGEPETYGFGWMVLLNALLKGNQDFTLGVAMHTGEYLGIRTVAALVPNLPNRGHGLIEIVLSNDGHFRACEDGDKIVKVYLPNVQGIRKFFPACPTT